MAEKLIITDLEFERIKTNLKAFLQSQSTFQDYNFEGSALATLLNLLAYNTYYNAYYANMLANELFIDTALVRNSLLSHAKSLNYTPISRRAPVAIVDVTVTPPGGNTQSSLTLDRFTEFQSEAIDGINYTFVTTDAHTVFKEDGVFPFQDIEIRAGVPQTVTFAYDPVSNPRSEFSLPNDDIDTDTLQVVVQVSSVNTSSTIYILSDDITNSNSNSEVYYLSTTTDNKYKLIFGDGALSKALSNGNIVIVTYLTTDGDPANRANSFATGSIGGFSNVAVTSISAAAGGAERETDDSIRFVAPLAYTAQGRAVTARDYETLIRARYPNIQSISVWGGEENIPPVYGKVFLAFAVKEGVIINEAEKERIIDEIINPISLVTVIPEIVDPDYVYLKFVVQVDVEQKLTLLTASQLADAVRSSIIDYTDDTLNQFGAVFVSSKFGRAIDDTLPAIIGSDTIVRLEKRFTPTLNVASTYTVSYKTELRRAILTSALHSTAFQVTDTSGTTRTAYLEEVFDSFTGVDSIEITNPGYGYTEAPTVTITGDGSGANATATIVNGKVQAITVDDRGTSYTSAIVSISGGGGQSAAASAVVAAKFGTVRLYYYNSNSEKVVLNDNIGTIDYENGDVVINDLKVTSVLSDDGDIRMSVEPQDAIIETKREQLLTVDQTDATAISISVNMR